MLFEFGLNPFEIRVSFEHMWNVAEDGLVSQSLRNQGFIRTDNLDGWLWSEVVSIPSKSGFHSNRSDGQRFLAVEFQRIRSNFIRSVVTFL